ncbi:npp1 domain-containing protein [Penicillium cataractarum]|uniref:Npp1 domain-containing protein n=1 Tax=Penicillium cataractarum TaxID=2100454 RepID=A0A9W9SH12_9EURO|nr:npp1 domain-containing protein [Penicillium cataractarum]KAJ5378215.1 npp1 domain-containing protein [Penicillium cataractarum]
MIFNRALGPLAVSALAAAAPSPKLDRRGTIASDEIVGFAQTVPSGTTGDVYLAYQPDLYVVNGCVPFPAVDADGNTNAGLATTGASDGDCSSSTGQIYVRGATSGDYYGLMYAWYMPKDEPSSGLGHRHDWEGVIVWLSSSTGTTAGNIVAVCPSAHGGWDCSTDGYTLDGTAPLIDYYSIWPVDHQCGLTSTVGGTQPLIAWESLPTVAQDALDTTDFGDAIVPFIDAHFTTNLENATF